MFREFFYTRLAMTLRPKAQPTRIPPPPERRDRSGIIGYEIDDSGTVRCDAPVTLETAKKLMHMGVFGPSGSGKSVALRTIGLADILQGVATTVFIDPRGDDLCDRQLEHLAAIAPPETYIGRLGIIDAGAERLSSHNPLWVAPGGDPEAVVLRFLARVMAMAPSPGTRWPEHLRNILMALCCCGLDVAPMDVLAFVANADYRRRVLGSIGNRAPFVAAHFRSYEALSDPEKQSWDAPVVTHVTPLIGTKVLRRLYQPGKPWDASRFIDTPPAKILLVSLRMGVVPRQPALLAASTILGDLVAAAFARESIPPDKRRPVFVTVDEAAQFAGDEAIRQMVTESRKYGMGLHLGAQGTVQIPTADLRREIVGNLHTMLLGRLGAADAYDLVREAGADDQDALRRRLMKLQPGQMLLIQKGQPPRFVAINKDPDRTVDPGRLRALREIGLETMGARPVAEVDAEIEKRYASLLGLEDGAREEIQAAPLLDVRPSAKNRPHRPKGGNDA